MALVIYGPSGTTTPATDEQEATILADLGAASAADVAAAASAAAAAQATAASAATAAAEAQSTATSAGTAAAAAQSTATSAATAAAEAQATAAAAYVKPTSGIPHDDLHQGIREQLDLADTALQPGPLPAGTTLEAAQISDATPAGRAVLTAADQAAQRTAMGAMAATLAGWQAAFDAAPAGEQAVARASVSGDRSRKLLATDTPSADSIAGTNTIVPCGLLATAAATGFTKLAVVSSSKPFSALQVGYIHVGGAGAASVKMAVASTDDPGPLDYALGGSSAALKKCVTPKKSGVEYNTYSANGWQKVAFGGVSSDVTPATIADSGSAGVCNILMSDVIPCASVAAADGRHYALIRVYDGAAPGTRGGIGYTGIATGSQYQDDAGFARFFGLYRGIDGVTDPSLWTTALTPSFSDTTQLPLVVRFVQGSIDGDAPTTGMMCGDSRFDAASTVGIDTTAGYRATAFLLARSLTAAGKPTHMIRACGGGYSSAVYLDRGSKLLDACSPAWAIYTVYTVNDGNPTQAIIDAAKLRAQAFVRKCASKGVRVGLVTSYPRTGMTAGELTLLTELDTWAAGTRLPHFSPLVKYGNADGTWAAGTNADTNHMTSDQYRVYAADLQAWLLAWSGI